MISLVSQLYFAEGKFIRKNIVAKQQRGRKKTDKKRDIVHGTIYKNVDARKELCRHCFANILPFPSLKYLGHN